MPTPSEQKALAFVAIVILLGGAVRVLRAGATPAATPLEQQGLARQASAADSASKSGRQARTRKGRSARGARDTTAHDVGGVVSVPPSYARPDRPFDHTPYGAPVVRPGFSPPTPRIDTDARGNRPSPAPVAAAAGSRKAPPGAPVDVEVAAVAEIEALPRIGPSLARRIVASRDSLGPFKSLAGLRRVKGIGPALLKQLAPLVVFGGRPDPAGVP